MIVLIFPSHHNIPIPNDVIKQKDVIPRLGWSRRSYVHVMAGHEDMRPCLIHHGRSTKTCIHVQLISCMRRFPWPRFSWSLRPTPELTFIHSSTNHIRIIIPPITYINKKRLSKFTNIDGIHNHISTYNHNNIT